MTLPEFLSNGTDREYRALATLLGDRLSNQFVFEYLRTLAEQGEIALGTNHLVQNFHFRRGQLMNLTITDARQTTAYYRPRVGVIRTDTHQVNRRGLRLRPSSVPVNGRRLHPQPLAGRCLQETQRSISNLIIGGARKTAWRLRQVRPPLGTPSGATEYGSRKPSGIGS